MRSDTFTLPTREMLEAILSAPLGDDGYREDPTVARLEELAATRLGKEAACLMPSGTMANLGCMLAHCPPGSTALVGDQSDFVMYEDKGLAECAGVTIGRVATQPDGTLSLADIEEGFNRAKPPGVAVLYLENPHSLCGGVVLPNEYIRRAARFVHGRGARLHLDGARIFNAAAQSGFTPAEIASDADSVQFCLSKGLAAPIGSVAAGGAEFIEKVRVRREMLGGNMRQAGVVAAPGIVALERMVGRLKEDHVHARRLAEGMARIPGIEVDLDTVQTNMVVFRILDPRFDCRSFIEAARRNGLNVLDFMRGRLRAVTHYGITDEDITEALRILARVLEEGRGAECFLVSGGARAE